MRLKPFVLAVLLMPAFPGGATIRETALQVAGDARTAEGKVRAVVQWTNRNLTWTYTDYQKRTPEQILERKGGNCDEQAVVVVTLLDALGVKTRRVHEINIQPKSEDRQKGAEELVAKIGLEASAFGLRHNDHVWIEFYDEASREWLPADPTLDLVGLEAWIRARVGFSARATHAIVPSRDMLVPIAIFAMNGKELESRSKHYLVTSFDAVYGGGLSDRPAWPAWVAGVLRMDVLCRGALEGRLNLHLHTNEIAALEAVYRSLNPASGAEAP